MITIGVDEAAEVQLLVHWLFVVLLYLDDCKMLTDRGVKDSKDLSASKKRKPSVVPESAKKGIGITRYIL